MPDERRLRVAPPRLALSPDEAAASLGVSRTFFYDQVMPNLRTVTQGGRRLIPVTELQAWLERNLDEALLS
jgi:excisionase family DNA binding protein